MRTFIPLITFTVGLLIGVFTTATLMNKRSAAPVPKDTGPMIHVEEMIIANQYDLHRKNDEWPSHDLIATYLTSFDRTFTDRMGNRVDAYRISSTSGHFYKFLLVGLRPDGKSHYLEQRNEIPPNI